MPAPTAPTPNEAHAPGDLLAQVQAHVVDLIGEEDPEFVAELIEAFIESSRDAVVEAQAARQSGDAAAVAAAAHTLRGSASNVGLATVARLWTEVEEGVRQGNLAVLQADFDRALAETARAIEQLAAAA